LLVMESISETQHTDCYVDLATEAVHTFVKSGRRLSAPESIPSEMRGQAGVFVSIKKSGRLRGCIGTFFPAEETIAREVIANAIKSASTDTRSSPHHRV